MCALVPWLRGGLTVLDFLDTGGLFAPPHPTSFPSHPAPIPSTSRRTPSPRRSADENSYDDDDAKRPDSAEERRRRRRERRKRERERERERERDGDDFTDDGSVPAARHHTLPPRRRKYPDPPDSVSIASNASSASVESGYSAGSGRAPLVRLMNDPLVAEGLMLRLHMAGQSRQPMMMESEPLMRGRTLGAGVDPATMAPLTNMGRTGRSLVDTTKGYVVLDEATVVWCGVVWCDVVCYVLA